MTTLSNPAFGPRLAVGYVTAGALIDVWTAVWYFAFADRSSPGGGLTHNQWFWLAGFFLTGLTLIILGVLIGPLGQHARKSELPPPEAKDAAVSVQPQVAAAPGTVVQGQPAVAANGTPIPTATPAPAPPVNGQQAQPVAPRQVTV